MFNHSDWDWLFQDVIDIWEDVMRLVYRFRFASDWQVTSDITAATVSDGDRPKDKPRPPSGGLIYPEFKPEPIPVLVA